MKEDDSWFKDQLALINIRKGHTLVGQLKPQFHMFDDENKILTLIFPVFEWEVNLGEELVEAVLQGMMNLTMSLLVGFYNRQVVPHPTSWHSSCIGIAKYRETVAIEASLIRIDNFEATVMCNAYVSTRGTIFAQSRSTYSCKDRI